MIVQRAAVSGVSQPAGIIVENKPKCRIEIAVMFGLGHMC